MKTEKCAAETPALVYPEADAEYIRETFEGALEVHARLVYETMTDAERMRAVGLCDADAYPSGPASALADCARFRADEFQHGMASKLWESAKRKAFEKRMAEREILSVEMFDPERKLSRMTNERGVTVEVHAARPLTSGMGERDFFSGVTREWQGDVRVFTRWRRPSVSVSDVELYRWEKMVKDAGLVLVGKGDDARYYLPSDVEEYKKHKAERNRWAEEHEAEWEAKRKREAAEREERKHAEAVGRARIAYEAALARAGIPVAPTASGDAVASTGPKATPAVPVVAEVVTHTKKTRGRPKGKGLSRLQLRHAKAAIDIIKCAGDENLTLAAAAETCAERHKGNDDYANYRYFTKYDTMRKWAQRCMPDGYTFEVCVEEYCKNPRLFDTGPLMLTN